jgi:hypothetical protein
MPSYTFRMKGLGRALQDSDDVIDYSTVESAFDSGLFDMSLRHCPSSRLEFRVDEVIK